MGNLIFRRGKEFYCNLENEIAQARQEILINVYSFQYDAIGKRFVEILKKKLDEGVAVRVILDGLGSRHDGKEVADMLKACGGDVCVFRPRKKYLRRHPVMFCRRDHARIFLIDRKLLGMGGICIGEVYDERQDLAALIPIADAGPVVSYFNDLWTLAGNRNNGGFTPQNLEWLPWVAPAIQMLVSTPIKKEQAIYRWAMEHIRSARERIVIVSAWFLPTIELVHALCSAEERGVLITIITPSHTDKRWYDDFRGAAISKLLKKNIAWYGADEYFHQKYFFVDDDWCLGSANFDMISMNRDYELNLCGCGGTVLEELKANFRALVRGSESIRRVKMNRLVRFLERAAYPIFEMFIVTQR
jgi:cardiolipin synthase